MSNKQIIVTQNNYGICIQTPFLDDKKAPLNIDGYAIEITIVCPDNSKLYRTGQVVDAANGIAEYVLTSEDTAKKDLYKMYFNLVDDNENITAQNEVYYYVKAEHGGV
jgi:uncharacterized protein YfaS (alpha-2-macroglobulin family)